MSRPVSSLAALALGFAALASCASTEGAAVRHSTRFGEDVTELEVQALVMQMADEYGAALGETTYLVLRKGQVDATGRWLAQSFLRNGMGAALDIASGPNPDVALLDLLVLGALQSWSFEAHWIPAGIDPESGAAAVARLREAEAEMWQAAGRFLSEDQARTLRELIDGWIAAHPERTVVSLVRFEDFTEERGLSTSGANRRAAGLLRELGAATAAVDDARLFGERVLWFASRYPYVLGQQAELSVYRMADQPELREALDALGAVGRLSATLVERLDRLEEEEERFFAQLREERTATLEEFAATLDASMGRGVELVAAEIEEARERAVEHFFARLAVEREHLLAALGDARETASVVIEAARAITETAEAAERVVLHFDRAPGDDREPLHFGDLRASAVAFESATERMTELLDRLDAAAAGEGVGGTVAGAEAVARELVDAIFWRGAALIGLLIAGLALVRVLPRRCA